MVNTKDINIIMNAKNIEEMRIIKTKTMKIMITKSDIYIFIRINL